MKIYIYRIHLEPEPEGGFTATVPALPGCVTWGHAPCVLEPLLVRM
jgi:predicted RNase H-like HicB family nuclease